MARSWYTRATTSATGVAWSEPVRLMQLGAAARPRPPRSARGGAGAGPPGRSRVATPATVGRSWVLTAPRACAGQAAGRIGLEPPHLVRQNLASGQLQAHRRFDRAQVFADHPGAGALGLQGHDVQQVVVRDSGRRRPRSGVAPGGDPVQPEQPHDVIESEPPAMTEGAAQRLDPGLVGRRPQPPRVERRQGPILALGVEPVGRGADPHLRRRRRPATARRRDRRDRRRRPGRTRPAGLPAAGPAAGPAATAARRSSAPGPTRSAEAANSRTDGDEGSRQLGRPGLPASRHGARPGHRRWRSRGAVRPARPGRRRSSGSPAKSAKPASRARRLEFPDPVPVDEAGAVEGPARPGPDRPARRVRAEPGICFDAPGRGGSGSTGCRGSTGSAAGADVRG